MRAAPKRSPNQRPGGSWGGQGGAHKALATIDFINPERKAAAQARAAELGISLGEFVRRAVDRALKETA